MITSDFSSLCILQWYSTTECTVPSKYSMMNFSGRCTVSWTSVGRHLKYIGDDCTGHHPSGHVLDMNARQIMKRACSCFSSSDMRSLCRHKFTQTLRYFKTQYASNGKRTIDTPQETHYTRKLERRTRNYSEVAFCRRKGRGEKWGEKIYFLSLSQLHSTYSPKPCQHQFEIVNSPIKYLTQC